MGNNTYQYLKNQIIKYKDPAAVRDKWIRINKNINKYADPTTMLENIKEAFTVVECVMKNILHDYKEQYVSYGTFVEGTRNTYVFHYETGDITIDFSDHSVYGMTRVLLALGYALPEELDDTRKLRNFVSHNLQTTTVDYFRENMNYQSVKNTMQFLGESLVVLGMLKKEEIEPTFDQLRVQEGDIIGLSKEFTVEKFIAKSGTSRLYAGRHNRLNTVVAIKELMPRTYSETLLMQERDLLVSLQHPQIPRVYDVFNQNGTFYIVMDYIDGVGLDKYISNNRLTMADKLRIMSDVCDVVDYLHSKKDMIHTDLKPQNVMIDTDGNVHIIDFGTALHKNEKLGLRSHSQGYTAPEVAEGKPIDYRIDIYSVGGIINYVFGDEINNPQMANSDNIQNICRIVQNCMMYDPNMRYRNVVDVKNELQQILTGGTVSLKKVSKPKRKVNIGRALLYFVCIAATVVSLTIKIADFTKNHKKSDDSENVTTSGNADNNTTSTSGTVNAADVTDEKALEAFKSLEQQAWNALVAGDEQAYVDLFRYDGTGDTTLRQNFQQYHSDMQDIYTDCDYILLCNENGVCYGSATRTLVSGDGANVTFVRKEFTYPFSCVNGEWKFDITSQTGAITESKYKQSVYDALTSNFNDARQNGRNYALLCGNNYIWMDSTLVYEGMVDGSVVAASQLMDGSIELVISIKNGTKAEQTISACTVDLSTGQGNVIVSGYRAETSAVVGASSSMLVSFTVPKESVQNISAAWNAMTASVVIE